MTTETDKLLAILKYLEEWEKLIRQPVTDVGSYHEGLLLFQADGEHLPGVETNRSENDREIWLSVSRLAKNAPPEVPENIREWVSMKDSPEKRPVCRDVIRLPAYGEGEGEREVYCEEWMRGCFHDWMYHVWEPWAREEAPRRRSIRLYEQLFRLQQSLANATTETPVEIVWGMGMASWKVGGQVIRHPLVSQQVEILPLEGDMTLRVQPAPTDPKLEADPFLPLEIVGLGQFEKVSRSWLEDSLEAPNPFYTATFEQVCRNAAERLDTNGSYQPGASPEPGESLQVSDGWVLFARKRSSSFLVDDLQRLAEEIESQGVPEGAPSHLVEEPCEEIVEKADIRFRGLSTAGLGVGEEAEELYFPKPFNDEQVEIIRRLETQPGLVVQGPPGTGKTHTIANVICHYLAHGKRVLVTSKGEAALSVLRSQIPAAIRPLTVSLLTNEREGREQLENAVNHINSRKTESNPRLLEKEIVHSEESIEKLHEAISLIDEELREWARRNTSPAPKSIGGQDPEALAREVVERRDEFDWFPDSVDDREEHEPQVSDEEISRLREARKSLGENLQYVGVKLPALAGLPSADSVLLVHESRLEGISLGEKIRTSEFPRLLFEDRRKYNKAKKLLDQIREHRELIEATEKPWLRLVQDIYTTANYDPESADMTAAQAIDQLVEDVFALRAQLAEFVTTPVELCPRWFENQNLVSALEKAAAGKRAFAPLLPGKAAAKVKFAEIRIDGRVPSTAEEWVRVREYGELQRRSKELASRCRHLSERLEAPGVSDDLNRAIPQMLTFAEGARHAKALALDHEQNLEDRVVEVYSDIDRHRISEDDAFLARLEENLADQLRKRDLIDADTRVTELIEQLKEVPGDLFERMRVFLRNELGNSDVAAEECEQEWQELLDELKSLHEARNDLRCVGEVTAAVDENGAKRWANQLRTTPVVGKRKVDKLIPSNWHEAWQWRRRLQYLDAIDGRREILRLTADRRDAEKALAREYERLIENRTWLRLVSSMNDRVSRAIVAYVKAIGSMTKSGKGRRDPQLRLAAREAMIDAIRGVPCWIMPQWRISEALPADPGSFDLVILDEASQSDAWAIPALVRGKKVLVVGDDKQVGPNPSFVTQSQIDLLMEHLESAGVPTAIRTYLDPKQSVYDLGEVIFAGQTIRLREHFRCAEPIIEFSNKLCYNHEIKCVRVPTASERLLPVLVDAHVVQGVRDRHRKINLAEAEAIIDEIDAITSDPRYSRRSIGVVSLLGADQARFIQDRLIDRIGEERYLSHHIRCGDARTFQGSEADIIFLSAVDDPSSGAALTENKVDNIRRINVAVSRARDRLYFYHSFSRDDLSPTDLRGRLLDHFQCPVAGILDGEGIDLCESDFEREVYEGLRSRGYRVLTQVPVGGHRIDMVVEGDQGRRLAIECDGDRYHGPERWMDDIARQRVLERAGWKFWRCWGSSFAKDPEGCLDDLVNTLTLERIEPLEDSDIRFNQLVEFRTIEPKEEANAELPEDFEFEEEGEWNGQNSDEVEPYGETSNEEVENPDLVAIGNRANQPGPFADPDDAFVYPHPMNDS